MTTEQQLIEALNQTVKTQQELITFLKAEVERLKSAQICIGSIVSPITGPVPGIPVTTPVYPWYNPSTPINPLTPYIVISEVSVPAASTIVNANIHGSAADIAGKIDGATFTEANTCATNHTPKFYNLDHEGLYSVK